MPSAMATAAAAGLATAAGSRVTRFAKSTAASVTPVRPGKTHALSALDNAMERHVVHVVLYYRAAPAIDRDMLKSSLSEVLSLYPAMTGRLTRGEGGEAGAAVAPGWIVKCNDAGVRMVDARAAVTLDEWLATASGDEEMDLAYFEPMSAEHFIWSPFYVQLTEFADKSYALGLSCTHIHNDPTAAALFFHGWAAAHRRSISPYPPFLHSPAFAVSPTSPPPAPPLLADKSAAPPNTDAAAMSSATFHFPAAAMRAMLSSLGHDTTPFAALAALFWLRVTAGAAAGEGEITLALDFRKKMRAPLPAGYYGSAVHFTRARADLASGLAAVAAALDQRVAGVPEEELWAAVEWLHARHSAGGEPFQMYGPELTFMALDHVPMYGAEFEAGGPPARVTCRVGGATGEGLVIVMPAAEGDVARDVVVTLPEESTARICRDEEVLRYGGEVVAGAKVPSGAKAQ